LEAGRIYTAEGDMIYRLLRGFVLLMSRIPLPVGQFLGRMLGAVFSLFPLERTTVSKENIRKSLVHMARGDGVKRLNRRVLMHFGQVLFEVPHIMRLNRDNMGRYVAFAQEENLREAMGKEKGVFILTGHFGNWEMMAAAVAIHFGPGAILVRSMDFRPLDRVVNDLRSRFGTEIILKERAMRRVMGAIKENKIVGILLDQNVDWYEGVFVDFLGQPACTNKGLALLALKTGAPIIPAFSIRQGDGRYQIVFGKEVPLIKTGDRTKDVEENTALFTRIIENHIRSHPDHWFWFHRRWKTEPYCPLPSYEGLTQRVEGRLE
jgi:KDO2-lipid IV(A) lauroyltransferase